MFLLGEMMVKYGIITQEQLDTALKLQKEKGKRLGEILIELGYISSSDLFWMLSEQADIPFVQLNPEMFDNQLISKFPEKLLLDNCILPLYQTENKIYVVIGDPTNISVIEKIKKTLNKDVVVSGADPAKIEQILNKFFLHKGTEAVIETSIKQRQRIEIRADQAVIEIEDKDGKQKKKGNVKIIIELEKQYEE